MAKSPSPAKKTAPAKKAAAPKKLTAIAIDKVNEQALTALEKLAIEDKLRSDIEWCLGSYRHDQNAVGLTDTAARALAALKAAKAKNAKAVSAKLITDLGKVAK
jgi:hypothetical protein